MPNVDNEKALEDRDVERAKYVVDELKGIPHIELDVVVEPEEQAWIKHYPCAYVKLDQKALGITVDDVLKAMWEEGEHHIRLVGYAPLGEILIYFRNIKEGDERIIAETLKKILT